MNCSNELRSFNKKSTDFQPAMKKLKHYVKNVQMLVVLLEELGKELSVIRRQAAAELEGKIKGEFKALRMEQVKNRSAN